MLSYSQHANASDRVVRDVERVIAQGKTAFQSYLLLQSAAYGTCIALDGDIQSCAADEALYHEALVHPALLLHPNPKRVLIMGGGEGATSREVLRHPGVERVVMVDIDTDFVQVCKQHIPEWNAGAFDDPRHDIRFEDINCFIAETDLKFDVVIGDLVDFADDQSIAAGFYSDRFYSSLKACLATDAILATQAGPLSTATLAHHRTIRSALQTAFGSVLSYGVTVPSFYALWGFLVAGPALASLEADVVGNALKRAGLDRNIDPPALGLAALAGSFALPKLLRDAMDDA
ncbi:MAG: spermidine synthase [Pseudomonadota bacterium]